MIMINQDVHVLYVRMHKLRGIKVITRIDADQMGGIGVIDVLQ
jgi:hypothetical protein